MMGSEFCQVLGGWAQTHCGWLAFKGKSPYAWVTLSGLLCKWLDLWQWIPADLQRHSIQVVKQPRCVLLWGLHKVVVEQSGCGTLSWVYLKPQRQGIPDLWGAKLGILSKFAKRFWLTVVLTGLRKDISHSRWMEILVTIARQEETLTRGCTLSSAFVTSIELPSEEHVWTWM